MSLRDWKGLFPREHGSWAYLLGPQVAALLASRSTGPPLLWFAGSLLSFCSFQAFAAALRRKSGWSAAGTIAGALGLVLSLAAARRMPAIMIALIPAGLVALLAIFTRRGRLGRQALLEVLGIAALSIQGAASLLLGEGTVAAAIVLAVTAATYFLLSLIWVRVRLGAAIPGREPLLPHGWNIPASLVLLLASVIVGIYAGGSYVGFLPGFYLARSLLPVPRRPDGRVRIPLLGAQEAVAASIFAIGLGLLLPV